MPCTNITHQILKTNQNWSEQPKDVGLVLFSHELNDEHRPDNLAELQRVFDDDSQVSQVLSRLQVLGFSGKVDSFRVVDLDQRLVFVVGLGSMHSELVVADYKKIGQSLARQAKQFQLKSLVCCWPEGWFPSDTGCFDSPLAALLEGVYAQCYDIKFYKEKAKDEPAVDLTMIHQTSSVEAIKILKEYEVICSAQVLVKDLGNEPANRLTPELYAARCLRLSDECTGLSVKVLDRQALLDESMHALAAVGMASEFEPRLVVLEWKPSQVAYEKPVALIGKGVTFDTGGVSMKPSLGLHEMKYDMCGSATVVGVMQALAQMKAPIHVVGVIALAVNAVDGKAMCPGDVIESRSGKSIEVLNTDAEGRLILADAIDYAVDYYDPACMIDLATLTGAIIIALGDHMAGLFSNNDELAKQLSVSGQMTGERLWRLPLDECYDRMTDSSIADVANLGNPARHAGSIIAAQFLQRFVKKQIPWAHLDIAGTAFKQSDAIHGKGATGFGLRLLLSFLYDKSGLDKLISQGVS